MLRFGGGTGNEFTHQFNRQGLAPRGGLSGRVVSVGLIQERHLNTS